MTANIVLINRVHVCSDTRWLTICLALWLLLSCCLATPTALLLLLPFYSPTALLHLLPCYSLAALLLPCYSPTALLLSYCCGTLLLPCYCLATALLLSYCLATLLLPATSPLSCCLWRHSQSTFWISHTCCACTHKTKEGLLFRLLML